MKYPSQGKTGKRRWGLGTKEGYTKGKHTSCVALQVMKLWKEKNGTAGKGRDKTGKQLEFSRLEAGKRTGPPLSLDAVVIGTGLKTNGAKKTW